MSTDIWTKEEEDLDKTLKSLRLCDLCKPTHGIGAITAASRAQNVSPHLYVIAANICRVKSGDNNPIVLPSVH